MKHDGEGMPRRERPAGLIRSGVPVGVLFSRFQTEQVQPTKFERPVTGDRILTRRRCGETRAFVGSALAIVDREHGQVPSTKAGI